MYKFVENAQYKYLHCVTHEICTHSVDIFTQNDNNLNVHAATKQTYIYFEGLVLGGGGDYD